MPTTSETTTGRAGEKESWVNDVWGGSDGSGSKQASKQSVPWTLPAETYKKIDERLLLVLGVFFLLIFVEGLLVAGAGFLPEDVDQFIVDRVFPTFTPVTGVFLLVSVAYGLFNTKVEPE